MNTNPNAKRILCYGDSNTQGVIPGDLGRYPANVRWTGVLQNALGEKFEIIEEGLWGRTTNLDDDHPGFEDKNGKEYLVPCLLSQFDLDFVILWLGSCDLKEYCNRDAKGAAKRAEALINIILKNMPKTEIILVSPPIIKPQMEDYKITYKGSSEKSKDFAKEYRLIAEKYNCQFVDMAKVAAPSDVDGTHFEKVDHTKIGKMFAEIIRKMEENEAAFNFPGHYK